MNSPDRPHTPVAPDAARLALLGHDLRSAVADVIGGLRLVDQSGLSDDARLQLERVRASGEVLARLLEEGLTMMLGEDDFAATHPANLQMQRFLYDLEMRWSGRAREKGLSLRVEVAPEVPPVLALDRIALERVLANTLSNAIKYTPAGTVALDVAMAPDGSLQLAVTDEGPGFSADALSRLFEFEGRPDGSGQPGHGLGMHIAKHMIMRLGGSVSVQNRASGGARVTIDLPPHTWTVAAHEEEGEIPDLSRVKVLVAEDNPTNQTILAHMLSKMGAEFEIAEDGVEALHWLERETFDLALIDIEMPRLSGLDVMRAVRAKGRDFGALPILAVTAYVLRPNREAIYAAGADGILVKPLAGIETFGQAISRVLRGSAQAVEPAGSLTDQPADLNRAQFDRLMSIAGPVAGQELLTRLAEDLDRVRIGLTEALTTADTAGIRAETHVLIALAGAVGAERLQLLAQDLNDAGHRRDMAHLGPLGIDALAQLERLIGVVATELAARGEGAP